MTASAILTEVQKVTTLARTLFFRFQLDGEDQVGYCLSHRLFVGGEKVKGGKQHALDRFLTACEQTGSALFATVIPKEHDPFKLQDGSTMETKWYSHCLWIGDPPPSDEEKYRAGGGGAGGGGGGESAAAAPPTDSNHQVSETIEVEDRREVPVASPKEREVSIPHPSQATHCFRVGEVKALSEDSGLIVLKTNDEFYNHDVYFMRSRTFIDGERARSRDPLYTVFNVGESLTFDMMQFDESTSIEDAGNARWLALLTWKGPCPSKEYLEASLQTDGLYTMKLVRLGESDPRAGVVSGLLEIVDAPVESTVGERVYFERQHLFVFNENMALADLGYVANSREPYFTDQLDLNEDQDGAVKYKSTFVWVGNLPCQSDDLSRRAKSKREHDAEFRRYLKNCGFDEDKFKQIAMGVVAPKNTEQIPSKPIHVEEVYKTPSAAFSSVPCQVVQLIRPRDAAAGTNCGVLKVMDERSQWFGREAPFQRGALSVFGHPMSKADLMHVLLAGEDVGADLREIGDQLVVDGVTIGPEAAHRANEDDAQFADWLSRHSLDFATFLQVAQGLQDPLPYFPFGQNFHSARLVKLFADESSGARFGLLKMVKGPHANKEVLLDRNAVYLWGVPMLNGDLEFIFKEEDKLVCEVIEIPEAEVGEWQALVPGGGVPRLMATIAWAGPCRPKVHDSSVDPTVVVEKSANFQDWLAKKGFDAELLRKLVRGQLPSLRSDPDFVKQYNEQKGIKRKLSEDRAAADNMAKAKKTDTRQDVYDHVDKPRRQKPQQQDEGWSARGDWRSQGRRGVAAPWSQQGEARGGRGARFEDDSYDSYPAARSQRPFEAAPARKQPAWQSDGPFAPRQEPVYPQRALPMAGQRYQYEDERSAGRPMAPQPVYQDHVAPMRSQSPMRPMEDDAYSRTARRQQQPDLAPEVEGNPVLRQARLLLDRVLQCATADDVNNRKIVLNEEELKLALFINKTLDGGIKFFQDKKILTTLKNPMLDSRQPQPQQLQQPRQYPLPQPQQSQPLTSDPSSRYRTLHQQQADQLLDDRARVQPRYPQPSMSSPAYSVSLPDPRPGPGLGPGLGRPIVNPLLDSRAADPMSSLRQSEPNPRPSAGAASQFANPLQSYYARETAPQRPAAPYGDSRPVLAPGADRDRPMAKASEMYDPFEDERLRARSPAVYRQEARPMDVQRQYRNYDL